MIATFAKRAAGAAPHLGSGGRLCALVGMLAALMLVPACDDGGGSGSVGNPGDVLSSASTASKVVALTFDDGPNGASTSALLDLLQEKQVSATFFLLGPNVASQPDLARRIQSEGHCIGSHGYDHSSLAGLPVAGVETELASADSALAAALGTHPRLFRPPGGQISDNVIQACRNQGYTIILWSVAAEDWATGSSDVIAGRVLSAVQPGSIILLHDGAGTNVGANRLPTVAAVRIVIDQLRAQGYAFTTVPGLF